MQITYESNMTDPKFVNVRMTLADVALLYVCLGTVDAGSVAAEFLEASEIIGDNVEPNIMNAMKDFHDDFSEFQKYFLDKFNKFIPADSIINSIPVWTFEQLNTVTS